MDIFSPFRVGPYELRNRIVMAPMARARCDENRAPTAMVAEYYVQRATAGLIVTEASSVSPLSVSRPHASAIYGDAHVAGWGLVAKRVHAAGGLIFQQLYHLGRKSDPSRMPGGTQPVAPSAIRAQGQVNGVNGPVDFAVPRALETDEVAGIVEEFRGAAINALRAGMDGVEIHGANCYLIDQFLRDGTNHRTDRYGGNVANRTRFLLEVVDAVIGVFGAERVGIRLSPHARGDGIADSDPAATFGYAAGTLNERGIAYLHLIEASKPRLPQSPPEGTLPIMPVIRRAFRGPLIVNGGYDKNSANKVIVSRAADLVAFGSLFIANPDLVERFRRKASLNPPDPSSFHQGSAQGYVDYPTLADAA
ncbi:MAG: alkene reductase [Xanthobacteraceae bacterium]